MILFPHDNAVEDCASTTPPPPSVSPPPLPPPPYAPIDPLSLPDSDAMAFLSRRLAAALTLATVRTEAQAYAMHHSLPFAPPKPETRIRTARLARVDRAYPCTVGGCEAKFARHYNLRNHMQYRHGVVPAECGTFAPVDRHPFKCTANHCGRAFSRRGNLKAHMDAVHGTVHLERARRAHDRSSVAVG
ncbi:hypothetical protein TRAPUB_9158 [Trametes pubescens]|uniref:C2H2-type domain-containing protein n=1 Tax=Trametes pubescens TaxID=154538 RepID=A0A1M2W366_TRAPU|nr:hypothetical protein TRAPUB_9158 [Trametes pubescens]